MEKILRLKEGSFPPNYLIEKRMEFERQQKKIKEDNLHLDEELNNTLSALATLDIFNGKLLKSLDCCINMDPPLLVCLATKRNLGLSTALKTFLDGNLCEYINTPSCSPISSDVKLCIIDNWIGESSFLSKLYDGLINHQRLIVQTSYCWTEHPRIPTIIVTNDRKLFNHWKDENLHNIRTLPNEQNCLFAQFDKHIGC